MQINVFALLFLATSALASRISYTCKYTTGGVSGHGGNEQKAGGSIPDNKDQLVISNIGQWSNGLFEAAFNKKSGVLVVKRTQPVQTKGEANDNVQRAQHIVTSNIR